MSVARFVADQRTMHRVPHVFCCRILGLSVSWFYKWLGREPTDRQVVAASCDAAVKTAFDASGARMVHRASTPTCSRTGGG